MSPGPCQLSSGFLLPHPCGNTALGACAKCGREACEQHAELSEAGFLCRACATGSELPPLAAGAAALAGLGAAGALGTAAALAFPLFEAADLQAFEGPAGEVEDDAERFADLS
jgi:hypothetical protein